MPGVSIITAKRIASKKGVVKLNVAGGKRKIKRRKKKLSTSKVYAQNKAADKAKRILKRSGQLTPANYRPQK